jgi:hypothetical protein
MFNLSEILQNAQGGKAVENLAQQYGISPDQVQSAMQALIPALSTGLQNKAADPGALGPIISAVTDSSHHASFSNTDAAPDAAAVEKGQNILGDLFGSNNITNQIAQEASKVTGVQPDVIAQLFPAIASLAMGGMAQAFHNQGLGGMLGQLASAAQQGNLGSALGQGTAPSSGGVIGVVTTILGGFFGGGQPSAPETPQASTPTAAPQNAIDALTKMFQPGNTSANFDQAGLQQVIGQILGGGKH